MKQYTRNEIIELRANKIYEALNPDINDDLEVVAYEYAKRANTFNYIKSIKAALATIEADEKAGVLMLVDDEPKEGDLVFTDIPSYYGEISIVDNVNARIKNNTISPLTDFYKVDLKIIQRNNTPVYQTRKED